MYWHIISPEKQKASIRNKQIMSGRDDELRPRDYKTFIMLNSAEHETFSANKYENANNSWHFHIY